MKNLLFIILFALGVSSCTKPPEPPKQVCVTCYGTYILGGSTQRTRCGDEPIIEDWAQEWFKAFPLSGECYYE